MNKMFKDKKMMGILGIVIVLVSIGFILFTIVNKKEPVFENDKTEETEKKEEKEEKKEITIIDVNSNSRPIAVMINNANVARGVQSGLQDAYIVYEMIVEYGITRMMAVFKDKDTARIGSVRSTRQYYLDYALENDAIYVHYAGIDEFLKQIKNLGVNNINHGSEDDYSENVKKYPYWRDTSLKVASEHTAFTSIERILKESKRLGYRLTSDKETLLNYTVDEVDLSKKEDSVVANSIDIKYSGESTTNYIYNPNEKLYYRSVNNKAHKDYVTKKQYTTKNIIVSFVRNYNTPGDTAGRQTLENIGTGNGYYITNGYAVPITWEKKSRESQTVYKYKDGNEIDVSDGNTFIQIVKSNSTTIK